MKNRSDYLLLFRVLIIVYSIYDYVEITSFTRDMVILVLLYVISSVLYFIFGKNKKSLILPVISIIVIISSYHINDAYIVLIPCSVYDIVDSLKLNNYIFFVLSISVPILLKMSISPIYIFIILLLIIFDSIFKKFFARIDNILKENDLLREQNYRYSKEIEELKSYEKQVSYTTQLEERNSLAQKMHDKIGHTIAGTLMQLEAVKYIVDKDKDKAVSMVDNSIKVLRNGMDDIRITLRKIKPPTEQLGINRTKLILEECTKGTKLRYALNYEGDLDKIKYNYWKVIIDSTKESLTNTIKYSKASEINVSINVLNKVVRIMIKDNGQGAYGIKKGLGLSGIEHRCVDVGGTALFDGSDGFTVTLLLPI